MQKKPGGAGGMIIGQQGQKYGLITRGDNKNKPAAGAAGAKGGAKGLAAAFGADSDSDEDIGAQVARQAARKVSDTKVRWVWWWRAALQQ
jgi:hypothetical protein